LTLFPYTTLFRSNRYYEARERYEKKRQRALAKANNRGKVAEEWLKTNRLTVATKPEFDKLMKQADRGWERENPK
jgi:hypothetical protein